MRRETKVLLIILLVSLSLFAYVLSKYDFGQIHSYHALLVTNKEFDALKSQRVPMESFSPPEVYIDEQQLNFDHRSQRFLVSILPEGNENPSVRTVSSLFRQYDVAISGDLYRKNSHPDTKARLLVYNQYEYKEFSLESTQLPIISIQMDEPTELQHPVGPENERARIRVYDNRPGIAREERTLDARTYIRLRGATSIQFAKRQYRLNLREFSLGGAESILHLNLLGLRTDDDWILGTPYNDPHKIREVFAHRLWYHSMGENNPYGVNTGTNPRIVELFIDGDYRGIYSLLFPIDGKQLNLQTNRSSQSDFYYRSLNYTPFLVEDFTSFHNTEVRGRFELRDPSSTGNPNQWMPLVEYMQHLKATPEDQIKFLQNHTYLPNQVDYYLFALFFQATDNDEKNHNYIAYWDDDRHVMIESPWDLDLTMGLLWNTDHDRNSFFGGNPYENPELRSSLITQAIARGEGEIIQAVQDRWEELRDSIWTNEHLMKIIDEYERLIFDSGAARRDRIRWPYAAYAKDLSEFREYVLHRLQSMDTFIEDLGGE